MHLQLAICYFVGFGVGMDVEQAYAHLATAARSQYPALRPLLVQMKETFSFNLPEQLLPPLNDEMAARSVSILTKAIQESNYCSPLYEISKTWQDTLDDEPDVGPELHKAAYLGDLERTLQLIQQGHRDHQNESQFTALMLACIAGSLPVVRVLLENGSDPSLKDEDGFTVWHMLVLLPSTDIAPAAELYQKHSKGLSVIDAYSGSRYQLPEMFDALVGTPLHWAVQTNNILAVDALLQAGARIDVHYTGLLSPIELAASLRLHSILELLLKYAISRSSDLTIEKPLFSMTECHPLRLVFMHGKSLEDATLKTLEILVNHWNINTLNSLLWTPILKVCLTGFSELDRNLVVAMLRWADENVEGQLYPVFVASILGCTNNEPLNAVLPLELIAKGFSVTAYTSSSNGRGYNGLHWAAACLNTTILQEILQQDPTLVHVPTHSPAGEYPLNIAAGQDDSKNLLSTLQILIGAGANTTAESKEHCLTPLGTFVSEQPADFDTNSLRYLLSVSKDNDYLARRSKSNPWTALHLATDLSASFTILGNMKPLNVLRKLLQFEEIRGLLEVRTEDGLTPILQAALRVDYPTMRVLIEAGADITTKSSEGGTCMSILLDQALYPLPKLSHLFPVGDFNAKWRHNAYRAAVYVCEKLRKIKNYHGLVLPKLHIAAYMCYGQEARRLVESREGDVYETPGERSSTTARMLLEWMLKAEKRKSHPLSEETIAEARDIVEYLKVKETAGDSA
jgi:ankyrin repeat protein